MKYKENCKIKNQKKFEILKGFEKVYRINILRLSSLIFSIYISISNID